MKCVLPLPGTSCGWTVELSLWRGPRMGPFRLVELILASGLIFAIPMETVKVTGSDNRLEIRRRVAC